MTATILLLALPEQMKYHQPLDSRGHAMHAEINKLAII